MARSNRASKSCSTRILADPMVITTGATIGSVEDGTRSPSRITFASATPSRFRPGPGERRAGSRRLRRASSPFHHRNDASDTPCWSANARADSPPPSHALTSSAHFPALILMPASLRRHSHPRKAAPSCTGYVSARIPTAPPWPGHPLVSASPSTSRPEYTEANLVLQRIQRAQTERIRGTIRSDHRAAPGTLREARHAGGCRRHAQRQCDGGDPEVKTLGYV